jgi:Raf kinase inhibitor-like YbhB/YbcL family protein
MKMLSTVLVASAMVAACGGGKHAEADVKEPGAPSGKSIATIKLTSPVFAAGAEIPTEHTCEGQDSSPPLAWDGVPAAAKALLLVVDDPDAPDPAAPKRVWVHWVVSLPVGVRELGPNAAASLPKGAAVGKNDWGKAAWGGPCPPIGRHRYFFKLYALDAAIDAGAGDKAAALAAADGHVLARGELIGTYQKKK